MDKKPHSRLLDLLGIAGLLFMVYIIMGWGLDRELGRPTNPIMDRLVVVWAIGLFIVLVIWWIRSDGGRK